MSDQPDRWIALMEALGCRDPVMAPPHTVLAASPAERLAILQQMLDAAGVRHFSATELCRPRWPVAARRLGLGAWLIPDQPDWLLRIVALALLADQVRVAADVPVRVTSCYRPRQYNAAVAGAPGSDHLGARGIDLEFPSMLARRRGMKAIAPLWQARRLDGTPAWDMSLGIGWRCAHVGVLVSLHASGRQRYWEYSSLARGRRAGHEEPA